MIAEYHPVPSTSNISTRSAVEQRDVEAQRVEDAAKREPLFSAFVATYAHWLVSPIDYSNHRNASDDMDTHISTKQRSRIVS